MDNKTRVRFAPSPTGHLHLGGARTALYDYLLAKQKGGNFILRIEDTDRSRLIPESEKELMDCLKWLGIPWDEGVEIGGPYAPYHQFERKDIYLKYGHQLIEQGKAFYCFCSPELLERKRQDQQKRKLPPHYDGTCREMTLEEAKKRIVNGERHVIRFKTPKDGTTTVRDVIRGEITVENRTIDDYVLVRSDGWALYHLAAIVDDHEMKISHVIRGSEWLSTFPLHALIIRALGWEEPEWIHLSVFLKPSGKGKMSKRDSSELMKDGYSTYIKDLQGLGYLSEAVINWIALMGWSYDDHTEFFTLKDLVEKFDLKHLNPAPAAINFSKLDYFNGLHIRALLPVELAKQIKPFFLEKGIDADDDTLTKISPIIQERIVTLDEAVDMAGFFFKKEVHVELEDLTVKGLSHQETVSLLEKIIATMVTLPSAATKTTEPAMRELVEQVGLSAGQVFGLMRIAVTGQKVSPPLFESMEIIGKENVMTRLKETLEMLKSKK